MRSAIEVVLAERKDAVADEIARSAIATELTAQTRRVRVGDRERDVRIDRAASAGAGAVAGLQRECAVEVRLGRVRNRDYHRVRTRGAERVTRRFTGLRRAAV